GGGRSGGGRGDDLDIHLGRGRGRDAQLIDHAYFNRDRVDAGRGDVGDVPGELHAGGPCYRLDGRLTLAVYVQLRHRQRAGRHARRPGNAGRDGGAVIVVGIRAVAGELGFAPDGAAFYRLD